MKIRFSILIILASSFFLNACSSQSPKAYVPVPGYPAPRPIKLVDQEESWKLRADRMMQAKADESAAQKSMQKPLRLASKASHKAVRRLTSQKKIKLHLTTYLAHTKSRKKTLAVW